MFVDALTLLTPTAWAMRLMLGICDDFAQESTMIFNAKKSKCLWLQQSSASNVSSFIKPEFFIGGARVDFVES